MLSEDHCSALRQVAQRAVLAPHQTDDLLQAAWGSQGKTCPYCREEMPWHRGVLLQSGHQVAWICMLCGLLEVGATKKFLPRAIGKLPTERGLPLPPGFALVWISTEMLPGEGSPSRWRAVDVARLLGHEIGERISAAILEDPRAARLSRPGYFDAADSPWRPLLLEEAWAQPKKGQRLLDYVSTMVETSTSNHVHNVNGLESDELETITSTHRPGLNDALPVLSEEVL